MCSARVTGDDTMNELQAIRRRVLFEMDHRDKGISHKTCKQIAAFFQKPWDFLQVTERWVDLRSCGEASIRIIDGLFDDVQVLIGHEVYDETAVSMTKEQFAGLCMAMCGRVSPPTPAPLDRELLAAAIEAVRTLEITGRPLEQSKRVDLIATLYELLLTTDAPAPAATAEASHD